jgi:DNA-binding XRE family transcriptional regulator
MRTLRRRRPKWTSKDIALIVERINAGASLSDLAREAGVSRQRIHQLVDRIRFERRVA